MSSPPKKLRVTKCAWLCFAAQCVMEQAQLFMPVEEWGLAGTCSVPQDQDPSAHKGLAYAHVCTHIPSKEGKSNQAAPHPGQGALPTTQSPLGNSLGWAEPLHQFTEYLLYLLTEYLEYFLNLNCTGERNSPLNCDQPDCRQNLKHSPTLGSICKVILPHSSRQVWQSKDHPPLKERIVSSFQGYSSTGAPITFSYSCS